MEFTPLTTVSMVGNTAVGTPINNKDLTVFGNAFKIGSLAWLAPSPTQESKKM
jgi:hypothetical protein